MESFLKFISSHGPHTLSESIDDVVEALTIPQNKDDKVESEMYRKLGKGYEHSDRIVRWYRNAKKSGVDEKELKKEFVDNLANIKDLFKTYQKYLSQLKSSKMLGKKVHIDAGGRKLEFDPVTGVDKIRRLEGFQMFVKAIGDMVHSGTAIQVDNQKYAITDVDRKRIRLVGFTEHIMCWCTEDYETTNKFVYQLWQNAKTLGRGDVYGDPSLQTPYCTHSKQHWDDYSEGFDRYQQFWFLVRFDNPTTLAIRSFQKRHDNADELVAKVKMEKGDLTNENVVYVFNLLQGMGPYVLIAMNDTGNDFLDSNDEHVKEFSELEYGQEIKRLSDELFGVGGGEIVIDGRNVTLHHDDEEPIRLKADQEDSKDGGVARDIVIYGDDGDNANIETLEGCPQQVEGRFGLHDIPKLMSLDGCPREVGSDFCLMNMPSLKSLHGGPKSVVGTLIIDGVPLRNLEGLPDVRHDEDGDRYIRISSTKIENLDGMDPSFDGMIVLEFNQLTSFVGLPQRCQKLSVHENSVESLKGFPVHVDKGIHLYAPNLKSLDYAPVECGGFNMPSMGKIRPIDKLEYNSYLEHHKSVVRLRASHEKTSTGVDSDDLRTQKLVLWHDIHTMPDGQHYRQNGPSREKALKMELDELKEMYDESRNATGES